MKYNAMNTIINNFLNENDDQLAYDADALDLSGLESHLSDLTGSTIRLQREIEFGEMNLFSDDLSSNVGVFKSILNTVRLEATVTYGDRDNSFLIFVNLVYTTPSGSNGLPVITAIYYADDKKWNFRKPR